MPCLESNLGGLSFLDIWSRCIFPYSSHQVQFKALDISEDSKCEREGRLTRDWELRNDMVDGEFPGFAFCLAYLRPGVVKPAIPKYQWAQIK